MADLPLPESGDIWLNSDTKAIKYNIEGNNFTQIPLTWFVAGETLSKGEYVSLGNANWTGTTVGKVYKTDSALTDKVLGIALNDAILDGAVEIQREGKYTFESAPAFFASHIGETVYIASSPDGSLTYDRDIAALDGNNLLSVGQIFDANSIIVKIEGDSRGPLGYTENQYEVGESITVGSDAVLACQLTDGKIYLASKQRSVERNNVVGFIISTGTFVDGDKVIVRRMGLTNGFSGLTPGKPLYASGTDVLGWGTITQNISDISPYYDSYIYVGLALSTTEAIVSIESPIDSYDDAPIGTINIIDYPTQTTSDSGYLLTEGQVLDATVNTEYQPLYDVIGNIWGGTDNTDFELPSLNSGSIKYQIKYKYFYQPNTLYTPIYRIEYPSTTTWQTYSNTDFLIDITSFGLTSEDQLKDLTIKMYAQKSGVGTISIPDLFQYDNVGEKAYGFTYEYVSNTSIRILLATNGLAYLNSSNAITVLDSTWGIKAVVYKEERFNRYRDSDADYKLNSLWDNVKTDESLVSYYSFDEVPEIPDTLGGLEHLYTTFTDDTTWTGTNGTVSVSDERLTLTSTVTGSYSMSKVMNFIGKTVRLRIKNDTGTRTSYNVRYLISGLDYYTEFTIPASGEVTKDILLTQAGSASLFTIRCESSGSIGDSFSLDWIYVGEGNYLTKSIDNSNNSNHGSMTNVFPVNGIQGKALQFNGVNSLITYPSNNLFNTTGIVSMSFFIKATATLNTQYMLSYPDASNSNSFGIRGTTTGMNWILNAGENVDIETTALGKAEFYHIVLIRNNVTHKKYVYLNGNLYHESTLSVNPTGNANNNIYLGSFDGTSSFGACVIDELKLFNSQLSVEEIRYLYINKSGDKSIEISNSPIKSTLAMRDEYGRLKSEVPSESNDVARKAETDEIQTNLGILSGNFTSHEEATTGIHGATDAATPDTLIIRDENGDVSVNVLNADSIIPTNIMRLPTLPDGPETPVKGDIWVV